ncbi:Putative ankyrin repeat protein FPV162 [Araneus ventricosus]|uniref:Ankyrin repeat protein FPV162 n=1 Tax=Araneus ventricosus TaxID=182803 RepID=A0A4Y2EUE4_ARAVE|nr:Putative ankyrin repeat protein FPV162 [Araneus ventricosus]
MNNTPFFWYPPNHRELPLHHLVETENNLYGVRKLLERGEDPNRKSCIGNTPLHLAVLNVAENGEIVTALIEAGADVNAKNCYKNTPLDFAVIYRKHAVIEILLQAGADVNQQDENGNTPLHYAIKNCLLFKHMNSRFVCSESNKRVDFWVVEKLLQHEAKIDVGNIVLQTPLYLAVEVGNLRLIRLLLKKGASTDVYDSRYGNTPLHIVLEKRKINLAIVFDLLSHGAKADRKNIYSITPWQLAIQKYFSSPWWEHENAKVLMKTFVLFTNEYRTFRMPRPTPRTVELYRFYQKCTFEADVMKSDVITLKYTVYDFVANSSDEEYLSSGYPERKACDYVFRNLKRGIYVVYVDEILNRIGRSYLIEEFVRTKLCVKRRRGQKVCLDHSHLQQISLYLSISDMFNFILAKSKYNWFNTSKGLLQRNILRVLHTYAPNFMKTSFILRLL